MCNQALPLILQKSMIEKLHIFKSRTSTLRSLYICRVQSDTLLDAYLKPKFGNVGGKVARRGKFLILDEPS